LKRFNGFRVFGEAKRLGEDVGSLFCCRNVTKVHLISGLNFLNVVITYVNVLVARVIHNCSLCD